MIRAILIAMLMDLSFPQFIVVLLIILIITPDNVHSATNAVTGDKP